MRLNWFSPLPPDLTDVANYTARIAPELMRRFDVTFWTSSEMASNAFSQGACVRRLEPGEVSTQDYRDFFTGACVFNIGNDARFHADIFDIAQRIPGIVILHDTRIHHFVYERFRSDIPAWSGYLQASRGLYGPGGLRRAIANIEAAGRLIDDLAESMPFLESVTEASIGVVCHSQGSAKEVRGRSSVPLLTLPLPYPCPPQHDLALRVWAPTWRFIIFGFLNPNRRLEVILRTLSTLSDSLDFRLSIIGSLWDSAAIAALIRELGLSDRVSILGVISEQELDLEIARAHLAFNLRHPTMGEASGALLRTWGQATPAVVTKSGWYDELPDTVVVKISIANESDDIVSAINNLVRTPQVFRNIGINGHRQLAVAHDPKAYVDALSAAFADLKQLELRTASRVMLRRMAMMGGPTVILDQAVVRISDLLFKGSDGTLSDKL